LRNSELGCFQHERSTRVVRGTDVIADTIEVLADECLHLTFLVRGEMGHVFHDKTQWLEFFNERHELFVEVVPCESPLALLSFEAPYLCASQAGEALAWWSTDYDIDSRDPELVPDQRPNSCGRDSA
jgi:hypothetical protein